MKKFYFKDTNKEAKIGGTISIEIDENSIPLLVEMGILEEVDTLEKDIVKHLSDRLRLSVADTEEFIGLLCTVNAKAAFILMLKETALLMDNKYEGHIKYASEIWSVENNTCKPFLLASRTEDAAPFDFNFNVISAFRNKEDVELALKVLKPFINHMNGK